MGHRVTQTVPPRRRQPKPLLQQVEAAQAVALAPLRAVPAGEHQIKLNLTLMEHFARTETVSFEGSERVERTRFSVRSRGIWTSSAWCPSSFSQRQKALSACRYVFTRPRANAAVPEVHDEGMQPGLGDVAANIATALL